MVLDVCASLPAESRRGPPGGRPDRRRGRCGPRRVTAELEARPEGQALFGIVQGGCDADAAGESAARTVEIGFDGYARRRPVGGGAAAGHARGPGRHRARSSPPIRPAT